MILDSTVIIDVLRDRSGKAKRKLEMVLQGNPYHLSRLTQFEILRGSVDEGQWTKLAAFLECESYVEAGAETWAAAARIHYELKRKGKTIRSSIDCYIAQLAIEHDMTLVHNDRDFETIAQVRPYRQVRVAVRVS